MKPSGRNSALGSPRKGKGLSGVLGQLPQGTPGEEISSSPETGGEWPGYILTFSQGSLHWAKISMGLFDPFVAFI